MRWPRSTRRWPSGGRSGNWQGGLSGSGRPGLIGEIVASAEYGLRLFQWIAWAWETLALPWRGVPETDWHPFLAAHDAAMSRYLAVPDEYTDAASLFRPDYWNWPGRGPVAGLGAAIEELRERVEATKIPGVLIRPSRRLRVPAKNWCESALAPRAKRKAAFP